MSRILVTGGAGFIGSHVVDLFLVQAVNYTHLALCGLAKVGEIRHMYRMPKRPSLGSLLSLKDKVGSAKTVEYFRVAEKIA